MIQRNAHGLKCGVVSVAGGGQHEESDCVSQSSPCQQIDDGESSWVVGLQKGGDLLGAGVTGLEVAHSVLLWEASLGDLGALEWEEHESAEEEEGSGAQADDQGGVGGEADSLGGASGELGL
jgi:hypothetical protein